MAMQAIPDDYEPEDERQTWADGKYKATGIWWFTLDERSNPILVAQKDGRMVGRLHFAVDGAEGPPMSVELSEMALLAKAFGVDPKVLPELPPLDQPGKVSKFMTEVEKQINNREKEVTIEVSNGWVNSGGVSGMDVLGFIHFVYNDIVPHSETKDVEPTEGQFGSYFITRWKVLGGEGGGPSPFSGATFGELLNYAVVVSEEGGKVKADWERTKGGRYTRSAVNLAKMMQMTAPQMFEEGYESSNPRNLLPEWAGFAEGRKQVLKGVRSKTERGKIRIDWSAVEPVYGSPHSEKLVSAKGVSNGQDDAAARQLLKKLLEGLADGAEVFRGEGFDLTPAGVLVAKTYLTPLKERGVLQQGMIKDLTWEQVRKVFENVDVPEGKAELLTSLRHKLAEAGIDADNVSTDF